MAVLVILKFDIDGDNDKACFDINNSRFIYYRHLVTW